MRSSNCFWSDERVSFSVEAFLNGCVHVSDYYYREAKRGQSIRFVTGFLEALMFSSERFKPLAKLVK